jgi:hypothetical protein
MLSPEQFAELITLIETNHDDGPKPEVRRAQRIAHPCRISITLGDHDHTGLAHLVQLKDISARGMCFLHNAELPIGSAFVVKLEAPDGNSVSILSNVVHCRQLDKNTYQIGAEFTCSLNRKDEQFTHEHAPEDLMRIRTSILD